MHPSYHKLLTQPSALAVCDVVHDMDDNTWVITRINIPAAHRGKGIGSELLRNTCKDADRLGCILKLGLNPYGPLDREQLEAWYKRYGFEWDDEHAYMVREPREISS